MGKIYKIVTVVMLVIITLTSTTFAANDKVSDWAKDEISKTAGIGISPDNAFVDDLTRPITRVEFARFAVFFLSAQYNMDIDDFINEYSTKYEIKPNYEAFVDTDDYFIVWAYSLGIVSGYGNGIFKPDSDITRQEAARMLLNVYNVFGDDIQLSRKSPCFVDDIADWAVNAVDTMYEWEVMRGVGETRFDSLGKYTVEQSIVTFKRLYENAPISRSHFNIKHFMTFDESLENILANQFFQVNKRFDLENYTVIFGDITGIPHSPYSQLWIIHKNGGQHEIFQHLPQNQDGWQNDFNIQDMKLNDDNSMITFMRNYEGQNYYYSIELKSAKLSEINAE